MRTRAEGTRVRLLTTRVDGRRVDIAVGPYGSAPALMTCVGRTGVTSHEYDGSELFAALSIASFLRAELGASCDG